MKRPTTRGRTPVKRDDISRELRNQIVSGRLRPGSRIPTRSELEKSFQSSTATVQSALDSLVRDGFVRVQGRQGTFVTEDLPFLNRYGFVFPRRPADGAAWPLFFTALHQEVARQNAIGDITLPTYFGAIDPAEDGHRQLEHDIRSKRLAGLVFIAESTVLLQDPLIAFSGLPMVCIADGPNLKPPLIRPDERQLIDKALDYMLSLNKRRIAIISLGDWETGWGSTLGAAMEQRGMVTHPHWTHAFYYKQPESARNCVDLLMRSRASDPFDALLITDDNLVEAAVEGMLSAGEAAWRDVAVIAHCNFPTSDHYPLAIKRIGFDARRIVAASIDSINSLRTGEQLPARVPIPAVFDHELAGTMSSGRARAGAIVAGSR